MNQSLRILRIANVPDNRTGGMNRTMHCTSDELRRLGHQVEHLFAGDLGVKGPLQLRRFVVPIQALRRVRAALASGRRFDVLEIHEAAGAACVWSRRSLPPVVLFSYGLEERHQAALLGYRRLKGLPIGPKRRYSPLTVVWQSVYATRRAAHVICSNSEDVDHLHGRGVAREKLTRHHSGVEQVFLDAGQEADGPVARRGMLYLGGWFERKGILDLIPAAVEVLRRFPDETLTVAGCIISAEEVHSSFPPELWPRIHVRPYVTSNADLIDLYRRHSVFVLPSFFEGQPLVMIEAAALGLAIVTTDVCGMRDFIRAGENGLTVPVADPAALAAAIGGLLTDPVRARRLGDAARTVARTHTWEAAAVKIAHAYRQATGGR